MAQVGACGYGGEGGAAFQTELVEMKGADEEAVAQVGVGQDQMGSIHALH